MSENNSDIKIETNLLKEHYKHILSEDYKFLRQKENIINMLENVFFDENPETCIAAMGTIISNHFSTFFDFIQSEGDANNFKPESYVLQNLHAYLESICEKTLSNLNKRVN